MANDIGNKHTCIECGTRFYDLQKLPAQCPKCDTEQPVTAPRSASVTALNPSASTVSRYKEDDGIRLSAEDFPEVDDDDDNDAVEEVTHSDHLELSDHNADDADDESIIESMGDETPELSIVTTIAEAEAAEK